MARGTLQQAFGQVLGQLRREAGLSQEDLALKSGVHRTFVSDIERGIKAPALGTIERLAQADAQRSWNCGISPSAPVRDSGGVPPSHAWQCTWVRSAFMALCYGAGRGLSPSGANGASDALNSLHAPQPGSVRRWYDQLLERERLPRVRFHDLRHTHATLMLAQGVHPKIVSERLGHASNGITLDTYSHVLPNLQEEAAGQLDSLFAPPA